jgi:hypothetical protein
MLLSASDIVKSEQKKLLSTRYAVSGLKIYSRPLIPGRLFNIKGGKNLKPIQEGNNRSI